MNNSFKEKVTETIRRLDLITPCDKILVAVSGGADSVSLLRVLHDLRSELRLELVVAHLNHMMRPQSADEDQKFVRQLAERLNVPYFTKKANVPQVRQTTGGSLEEAARNERYKFFEWAAQRAGATKIALGHNKNDNAETVLQRILRGTGLRGLGGIPPKRTLSELSPIQIIRPLLECTRREILEYLAEIGQDYRTDETNADVSYHRNRIRHVILPHLEEDAETDMTEALNNLAQQARSQYHIIYVQAEALLGRALIEDMVLQRAPLKQADPELAIEAMRLAVERAGGAQLSSEQSRKLLDLLTAETGTQLQLPGKISLIVEYDRICIHKRQAALPEADTDAVQELAVPGRVEIADCVVAATVVEAENDDIREQIRAKAEDDNVDLLDYGSLALPLQVRTRRPGDAFRPLGAPGKKKLHDFFIDEKVPAWRRDSIPLVCDQRGIVWVAGSRVAHRVRVNNKTTRAVELTLRNREP